MKHFGLSSPLGRSELGNDQAPAFHIRYLNNEITGSESYMTGSFPTMQIPQLRTDIIYETQIEFEGENQSEGWEGSNAASTIYADGSYVTIKDDYILLEIKEANTDNFKENFDIEVYIVEEEDVSGSVVTPSLPESLKYKKEKWVPLSFYRTAPTIVDNILLDQELTVTQNLPTYTPDFVEYYFDLYVDYEIDRDLLCGAITTAPTDDYFGDPPYECPEANTSEAMRITNPYTTTTTSDDITDCEPDPANGASTGNGRRPTIEESRGETE